MIRTILVDNLKELDENEKYIVSYLTKVDFDMLANNPLNDTELRSLLYSAFMPYFGYSVSDGEHPFYKVWEKFTDGANIDELIVQTDLYGKTYEKLAKRVNEVYMSRRRKDVLAILSAFAVRDFESLQMRYEWGDDMLDIVLNSIEHYADEVVTNLDERDLKTILTFCGVYDFSDKI